MMYHNVVVDELRVGLVDSCILYESNEERDDRVGIALVHFISVLTLL